MSTVDEAPAVTPSVPEAPKVKKSLKVKKAPEAKKVPAKKTVPKKTVKKPAPKAKKPRKTGKAAKPRKNGLRTMQVRALTVLAKVESANIQQISEKSGVGYGVIRRGVGADHPDARAAMEKELGFPSLLTLGMARTDAEDEKEPGVSRFVITGKGRKALEKHQAEHGKKLPEPAAAPYSKNKRGK